MARNTFLSWDTTDSNNTDVGGNNIAEGCPPSSINNAIRNMMAQLRTGVDGNVIYATKSGNYTAVANDNNAVHFYTATATVALTAAATLAANWHYTVVANGADVTIDPNGSETINGLTTLVVPNGSSVTIICDGTKFLTAMASNNSTSPTSGFRNQLINGDFLIWQRAQTQSTSGYGSDDRWFNLNTGTTKTHSLQTFTLGQTAVPGNPVFFSRTAVTSVAGASNNCLKVQKIESVYTLQGQTATLTFWAKADASKNMAVEFVQSFGTGGSPSADVTGIGVTTIALTTSWQRFNVLVTLPSISGKTAGTASNHNLQVIFWFDAGSSFNSRSNTLGQQSGTFDIAHVSLVQGDARTEADPFSPRHYQQELALCQRYFQNLTGIILAGYNNASGQIWVTLSRPTTMRATGSTGFANLSSVTNVTNLVVSNQTSTIVSLAVTIVATGQGFIIFDTNSDAEL